MNLELERALREFLRNVHNQNVAGLDAFATDINDLEADPSLRQLDAVFKEYEKIKEVNCGHTCGGCLECEKELSENKITRGTAWVCRGNNCGGCLECLLAQARHSCAELEKELQNGGEDC